MRNDDRVAELLAQFEPEKIPLERRVFANRNLRMSAIEMIGFDMDYTLAVYFQSVETLQIRLTVDRLISERQYPPEIASLEYDPNFAIRGLTIDKRYGHLLKMDSHRHISRCFHGKTELQKKHRRELYRNERIRMSAKRFALIDTLFAVPEAWLFAELCHLMTEGSTRRLKPYEYKRIFDDIRETIDTVHADQSLKRIICADLPAYIEKDPALPLMLHRIRSAGKKTFLMTNSYGPYTNAVMTYLLDDARPDYKTWQNYFDIVVVGSKKPSFFADGGPFLMLGPDMQPMDDTPAGTLEPGAVYQGGNLSDFERMAGVNGDNILYVGDHLYGDILRSKKATAWRTAMIIPELEQELRKVTRYGADFARRNQLETHRAQIDLELHQKQQLLRSLIEFNQRRDNEADGAERGALSHAIQVARADLKALEAALRRCLREAYELNRALEDAFNSNWGPLFKARAEHSVFGAQVEDYACIYTSRATNLASYSPFQYFRTPRDLMPHEQVLPPSPD